jgi:hypothetical protein
MVLKQLAIVLLAAALIAMTACGSGKSAVQNTQTITGGNWLLIENTTAYPAYRNDNVYLRGPLQISGDTMTANFNVSGNPCLPSTITFSGTTSDGIVNMTSAPANGQVMAITGSINPGDNIGGTYTKPGGVIASCTDDSGTVYGTYVPPINGNWSGDIAVVNSSPIVVNVSIQQAAAASPGNIFPISGTLAASNDTCFTSGTINDTQSYINGEQVVIVANSGVSTVTLTGYLVNPTLSTQIQVTNYTVPGCIADFGTEGGTLNIS